MTIHIEPKQCLAGLKQEWTDGGRFEFLGQEAMRGMQHEHPTGDCAIAAYVHAAFQEPSGQAYRDARDSFLRSTDLKMYQEKNLGETAAQFAWRRIKQTFRPPAIEPMHGTPSRAKIVTLGMLGYEVIYPNDRGRWYCICDEQCAYVLDVMMHGGGHTMTVIQGTAYTTAEFDPQSTLVANVFWLPPEAANAFRAAAKQSADYELWLNQMLETGKWSEPPRLPATTTGNRSKIVVSRE